MRIGVLGPQASWHLNDLRRAAADRHEILPLPFERLVGRIGGTATSADVAWAPTDNRAIGALTCGDVPLASFDALLVRTMPSASLEPVVFRMDILARCQAAGIAVVNPPKAIEAAVDKYLTTARLAAAGLRVPRTAVCQTVDDALAAFDELAGDVVVKPLFGGEGRGIARLVDRALAERAFRLLADLGAVIYLQEFIAHPGYDLRLLLIGGRCWAIRRRNPLDWRTNLSRGAVAEPIEPSDEMIAMARRAADAVGALVAGVDLLSDAGGTLYAIEVNAVPGWRGAASALGVDIAAELLSFIEARVAHGSEMRG
jgi:ribosomal protein S6--L-glutamate ligase